MRVIAGSAKGHRLYPPPKGVITRPITDRAKESLFNIIGPKLGGAKFLDLFAGTGAVGIEALSRGADSCTFVELSPKAHRTLTRNLDHTKLADRGQVVRCDVFDFLTRVSVPYDIIFLAPPQYQNLWEKTLGILSDHPEWLAADGIVIVQIDPTEYKEMVAGGFTVCDKRQYSNVFFGFYKRS